MILKILILYCSLLDNTSDTLKYPLKEGEVKIVSETDNFHPPLESIIYPTKFFEITSCSSGKVANVIRYPDGRTSLFIKSGILLYAYTIDTVFVSKGQLIQKGQILGELKHYFIGPETKDDYPLIFIVNKDGKDVDARKYLIYETDKM